MYMESGVEWLGDVPTHWRTGRLLYLAELLVDGTHHSPESWPEGAFKYVTAKNVRENGLDLEDLTYVTAEAHREIYARCPVQRDDVLYIKDGATAGIATVNSVDEEFSLLSSVAVIRPKREVLSPQFLAYHLNAQQFKQAALQRVAGGAMTRFTLDVISRFLLAIPPLTEQRSVAAFLDHETARIDALIAEQERLIELLQEKRQAVILRAVTKGLNANVQTKSTGVEWLGDVPMHWEVVRLGALYAERNVAGSDELPILTVSIHTGVSDDEIDENDVDRKVVRSDDRSKYKAVQPGDLVYNMMRAWQGGMGAVSVVGQVSPAYVVAQPRRPILTEFVEYLLRTPQGVEEMRRHSRGITDFRLRLYWDEFKQISICLPSAREQVEIVDTIREAVARFDALAREAGHAVELLSEHRSALISAAVTGQIDVRGLVPEAAA